MIIISCGLPKSASTLIFEWTEELIVISGKRSGQKQIRAIFKEAYVHKFGFINTFLIFIVSYFCGSIVVKTHSRLSLSIRMLIYLKLAKATYTTRDPRDIILSAIDSGKTNNQFAAFTTIENTIPQVIIECKKWERWREYGNALFLKYENSINEPLVCIQKIAQYINCSANAELILSVLQKKNKTVNFNKGTDKRYLVEMTEAEKMFCTEKLKQYILKLGYSL